MTDIRGILQLAAGFLGEALSFAPSAPLQTLFLAGDPEDRVRVGVFLERLEKEQKTLADHEYLVVLLGYEAQVALHKDWPRHERAAHHPFDAAFWRVRAEKESVFPDEKATEKGCNLEALGGDLEALGGNPEFADLTLRTTREAQVMHEKRIADCLEELFVGTLYQANLAHALSVAEQDFCAGYSFYQQNSAADFSAFVDVKEWGSLISLSPECFFKVDLSERWVRVFPIKGTVPRGANDKEDERQKELLLQSEKDAAEHLMIVDLMRNDLGQLAKKAGVSVEELMRVVPVKNVFHLESVVRGDLRPEVGLAEIIAGLSPGGSITGAPKSAAVEVIHELEAGARGPYTGTLGVLNAKGQGTFNILIRTWLRPDYGCGELSVGGGVVVNSSPKGEWQETLDKAAAFGKVEQN